MMPMTLPFFHHRQDALLVDHQPVPDLRQRGLRVHGGHLGGHIVLHRMTLQAVENSLFHHLPGDHPQELAVGHHRQGVDAVPVKDQFRLAPG